MKVITSFTLNWDLDVVQEESFEYEGPVAECKGGGGDGPHYEALNRLYNIQADQAEVLGRYAKDKVLPAYGDYLQEAQGYGSQANQEQAATRAGADAALAGSNSRQAMVDDMNSLGINPADARYQGALAKMGTDSAAQQAAAMTGARDQTRRLGMAYTQDAVSLGMGTPTQAAAAASGAANSANAMGNLANQQQANQVNGIANTIRGGMDLYGYLNKADGGLIHMKDGGYVNKYAMGGIVRMGQQPVVPPPPAPGGQLPTPDTTSAIAGSGLKAASSQGGQRMIGQGLEKAGSAMGSDYVNAMGRGMQGGPGVQLEMDIYNQIAQDKVNQILPSIEGLATDAGTSAANVAGDVAMNAGADVAADAAVNVGTDVAAAAATEAGLAMGANVIPVAGQVISAALLAKTAGDALGWWADGGEVTPNSAGQTGEVDGPGGPKDDLIPAMLSDGEFVMPIGAVKKFGLARLEKMRQEGLQFEQELGIRKPENQNPQGMARGGRVNGAMPPPGGAPIRGPSVNYWQGGIRG
jgi:hypothetical protein